MLIRKVCVARGCMELALEGLSYCSACEDARLAKQRRGREQAKFTEAALAGRPLYDAAWQKASTAFLRENPVCVECASVGVVTSAQEVDHIDPHRGDRTKFWDRSNWQALCKSCHSRKTAREVFAGRRRKGGGGRKI